MYIGSLSVMWFDTEMITRRRERDKEKEEDWKRKKERDGPEYRTRELHDCITPVHCIKMAPKIFKHLQKQLIYDDVVSTGVHEKK